MAQRRSVLLVVVGALVPVLVLDPAEAGRAGLAEHPDPVWIVELDLCLPDGPWHAKCAHAQQQISGWVGCDRSVGAERAVVVQELLPPFFLFLPRHVQHMRSGKVTCIPRALHNRAQARTLSLFAGTHHTSTLHLTHTHIQSNHVIETSGTAEQARSTGTPAQWTRGGR